MILAKKNVAIIYDGFPHYRKAIIEELSASPEFNYYYFADTEYRDPSISLYRFGPSQNFIATRSISIGPLFIQWRIFLNLLRLDISYCVFLGNPHFLACWTLVPLLRLMGKRVYFWTHGWISANESPLTRIMKDVFFSLPNELFLYGNRSKLIGQSHGFKPTKMHVINNCLDYLSQKNIFSKLATHPQSSLRNELGLPLNAKIIICTARITQKCRFDLLINAAVTLKDKGHNVFLVFVGDGPEKKRLEMLAFSVGISYKFWGACFDEEVVAKLYKASDLTVSPGKVGLTAIHSMAYGTPVISHGNFDHQMPECEAIIPGITGDFFAENSTEDLANVINKWFIAHSEKPETECINRVESEFTPAFQRRVIEDALKQ